MPSVVLVSDMHGHLGDTRYMDDWRDWWSAQGFAVGRVYMDELLPGLYELGETMQQERLHAMLTQDDVADRARQALLKRLHFPSPEIVLGFSYGGFLAATVHEHLGTEVSVMCISATRLRHALPLSASPRVHALFGANDPFTPPAQLMLGAGLMVSTVPGHGHEVYRHPEVCGPHIVNALPLRYRKGPPPTSASLSSANPARRP